MPDQPAEPDYDDVAAAAHRLAHHAQRTPVLRSRLLDEELGLQVFFKAEHLQRTGAFKFRGAFNALAQFTLQQRRAGVVAFSSGNHAQAIALAAQLIGVPATIVMPLDAPVSKMAATRAYGGEVVTYDRYSEDRELIARELVARRGLTLIPPYDHPHVIAGQGTAALELVDQIGPVDALFVPLGGGGLLSGSLLAMSARSPRAQVFGVEPQAGDDGRRSLRAGSVVRIATPETIADGAQTQQLGSHTFEIIRRSVSDIVTVTDAELVDAMRFFAARMKQVVEPTGCLGLAGLRAMAMTSDRLRGMRVGVLISGGNVDLSRFAALVCAPEAGQLTDDLAP